MTDQPPVNLDYDDGSVGLDIAALLARGRRARRQRRVLMAAVSGTTALALVGAGASVAAVHGSDHSTTDATAVSADSPWTQTQGNAAASRSNITETTLTSTTVTGIRHLRTYTPPGPGACTPSVGSVLTGGDVITLVNDDLVRYAAQTDRVVWQTRFGDGNAVDLAVTGDEVLVGYYDCGTASDPEGWIAAYSLSTGKQLWRSYSLPSCDQGTCNDEGGLAGMEAGGGDIITGGNALASGYSVAVLKASDGSAVWEDTTSQCAVSAPILVDQQVIFTKCNPSGAPRMVADAVTTGKRTWQDSGSWTVQRGDFSQSRGHNLLATDPVGEVVDVNPATGKVQDALSGAGDVLAVDGLRAYATCGTPVAGGGLSSVCGYSLASGRQLWTSDPQPDTTLAVQGGDVLYLDSGVMLNSATGTSLGTAFIPPAGGVDGLSVGEGRLNTVTPTTSQLYGLKGE